MQSLVCRIQSAEFEIAYSFMPRSGEAQSSADTYTDPEENLGGMLHAMGWQSVLRSGQRKRTLRWRLSWPLGIVLSIPCIFFAPQGVAMANAQPSPTLDAGLLNIRTLISGGKYSNAEGALHEYLVQKPDSPEAHTLLAFVLFHEAKAQASLDEYTKSARLRTPTADDLRIVALDYVLLNDYEDASKWMAQSLAWKGSDPESWYEMGRIKYTQNRFQESIECFQKSLQLLPRSVKAENNLGLALEGLNRNDDAIAAYRQAIAWQENSDNPSEQPLINLAIVLVNRDQLAEALPLLVRAQVLAPKETKVHEQLGRLYLKQEQLDKARAEMETAVELSPGTAGLHFQLGQIYKRLGLTDKARAEFAKVGQLSGGHSSPDPKE
ncbi:MAG TPA: tetratricopeptide repeat protein [Acidisarcina sp.]|nr:tetratricopeptide repeat protein [Acidisarcina sp.]